MRSPDDECRQARRSRFERRQVADAAFVAPAGVIDHENVAGFRGFHRFEKDIDAPKMFRRKGAARGSGAGNDRRDPGRRNANRNFQP